MTLTVELPDDLAQHADSGREVLQAVAVEAFRSGTLTKHEAAQLAKMGRIAFNDLLISCGVTHHLYGVEDFLEDMKIGDRLRAEGKI